LASLRSRALALVARLSDGSRDDAARDALVVDLLRAQAERVEPYGRLVRARHVPPAHAAVPDDMPALPTDVFRFARVAAHDEARDVRVFRTSGTTQGDGERGVHPFADLSLYDVALEAAARHMLFFDAPRMRLVILAPDEHDAPDSSLSYMLTRFADRFGDGETTWALGGGRIDVSRIEAALARAEREGTPVALLGTSFAFVHADDALGATGRRFALPPGSRVMQTGGFKGRSREVPAEAMREMLSKRYGVAGHAVIAEYGMTELSSQMYETTLRAPAEPRRLWVPGWVRATPVDPESLTPVAGDAIGILRIDDVANVDGVCAIQTSDLARRVADGIEVLGRAPGALPRGCSLAIDAVLSGAAGGPPETP
jgi:hypothetical protein